MFPGWVLLGISLAYVGVLFALAWWGDRAASLRTDDRSVSRPVIYSLSLAVYCTSWTFYGAVGQAATSGWDFLPIYLGPALVFTVFGGFMIRLVQVSKEQNITSIADFIAARYGKTQGLAVCVTIVAVIGLLPYIALQLKAIAMGYHLLTTDSMAEYARATETTTLWNDTALAMALLLAVFTILFGTRQIDATEHHPGLMLAIAFESLVKLVAFLAVGFFVVWGMHEGLGGLLGEMNRREDIRNVFAMDGIRLSFLTTGLLAMTAIFCLPRQFHVAVVENTHPRDVRKARWMFPLYLLAISAFIVPIAIAGMVRFDDGSVDADTFMITLPMSADAPGLALLALLGGFSAATGMVIVATVALSTMVSNELVMPALLRMRSFGLGVGSNMPRLLLIIRRTTIVALLLAAYAYHRLFGELDTLAAIGLLSFAAVAQFAPPIIAGMYWNRANRYGAMAGLVVGFGLWAYTLLLPGILRGADTGSQLLEQGLLGLGWLTPEAMLGLGGLDSLTHGVLLSLGGNVLGLIVGSLLGRERSVDRVQAGAFVGPAHWAGYREMRPRPGGTTVREMRELVERFVGPTRCRQAFTEFARGQGRDPDPGETAQPALVRHAERILAAVIGASSARTVVASTLTGRGMRADQVLEVLDQASQEMQFREELLRKGMDNLSEGISVVDGKMRLVAWNRRYLELFEYPDDLIVVGRPIEEIIRFNARRGLCGPGSVEEHVTKRMAYLRRGSTYSVERYGPGGTILEIRGNPMPGGGFVTSFTDVTERKRTLEALRESEESIRIYTDNMPALIAFVDADLRLRFCNRAYAEALGQKREDIMGREVSQIFAQEEYLRRSPYLQAALDGHRQDFEIELPDSTGGVRYALGTYIPQTDANGGVQGFFALFQDITDRREAEINLQEAYAELEQRVTERTRELTELNEELSREISIRGEVEQALLQAKSEAENANLSKTRFLAAASHDLLQPLNAARLFTSALHHSGDQPPQDWSRMVDRVDSSLQSAETLLTTLLDISRLDAGALQPSITRFRVSDLLERLHTEFGPLARNRGLEFRRVGCSLTIESDQKLLRRILQNFVSNAMRYTRDGRVTLGCRRLDGRVRIEIWDTGPGIPETKYQAIFEEFHRLDSDEGGEKGLGLGLAIAERMARVLDHPLGLRSWPGRGSVFSVTVPVCDAVASGSDPAYPASGRGDPRLTGMQVLCIDNEAHILEGMEALVSRWGCRVHGVRDEAGARRYMAEHGPPAAILADYHLDRGANGATVLDALKAEWGRSIAGVIITADHTEKLRETIVKRGYQFLQKPVKPAALRAVLSQISVARSRTGDYE